MSSNYEDNKKLGLWIKDYETERETEARIIRNPFPAIKELSSESGQHGRDIEKLSEEFSALAAAQSESWAEQQNELSKLSKLSAQHSKDIDELSEDIRKLTEIQIMSWAEKYPNAFFAIVTFSAALIGAISATLISALIGE